MGCACLGPEVAWAKKDKAKEGGGSAIQFSSDLDGTLARAFLEITPRVVEAVGRVAELVPVGIVSSRDYTVVGRVARELGLRSLQISEGTAGASEAGAHSGWRIAQTTSPRCWTC